MSVLLPAVCKQLRVCRPLSPPTCLHVRLLSAALSCSAAAPAHPLRPPAGSHVQRGGTGVSSRARGQAGRQEGKRNEGQAEKIVDRQRMHTHARAAPHPLLPCLLPAACCCLQLVGVADGAGAVGAGGAGG